MITRVYFETFLKRHRALRQYKREIYKAFSIISDEDSIEDVYRNVIKYITPKNWIKGGMAWDHTIDGRDYWAEMDELWEKEIDKIKRKEAKA